LRKKAFDRFLIKAPGKNPGTKKYIIRMEVKKMSTFIFSGLLQGVTYDETNAAATPPSHEQLKTRPDIEDVICHNLEGDTLKEALFIIDNIRENRMKIKWSSVNVWSVQYKRKHVCDLSLKNGNLIIGKISDILVTRVKNLTYNTVTTNPMFDALLDLVNGEQEAYAMQ